MNYTPPKTQNEQRTRGGASAKYAHLHRSETFDWDTAITRFHAMMRNIYRNPPKGPK
jgi:hypothetical protein